MRRAAPDVKLFFEKMHLVSSSVTGAVGIVASGRDGRMGGWAVWDGGLAVSLKKGGGENPNFFEDFRGRRFAGK